MKILIKNGRVWDGQRFFSADVLTDGPVIEKIAPHLPEEGAWVFDAAGKTVCPGLVDAHVHMLVAPGEQYGFPTEMGAFPFGVTAVADAGRTRDETAVLDVLWLKHVLLVSVPIQENRPRLEVAEQALAHFGDRAIGLKVYFDTGVSEVTDITPLQEICAFAKSRNLRVMVHCSGSPTPMAEILETLNPGDILTHAFHGGRSTAAEDGFESMQQAQRRGIVIDTGFAATVHTNFAVLRQAIQSGIVPDCISTDITKFSAFTRGGRYGLTMAMSMARAAGMEEEAVFRAVTANPAAALGKTGQWGLLREGGPADLAVLEECGEGFSLTDKVGNVLESALCWRCLLTVVDGQIVYKD